MKKKKETKTKRKRAKITLKHYTTGKTNIENRIRTKFTCIGVKNDERKR